MTTRKNKVPEFGWRDHKIVPGTRIRVVSRHGSTGNGTVVAILEWANTPDTICAEMDSDTVYSNNVERGWMPDKERILDIGLFGGEIKEILKKN